MRSVSEASGQFPGLSRPLRTVHAN
jgi:hypothetical protein